MGAMRKMLSIKIFDVLDSIASKHDIKAGEWALQSDLPQSRISELRAISKEYQKSGNTSRLGRLFTIHKCTLLVSGLQKILGRPVVRKEILEMIAKMENRKERLMLMLLVSSDLQDEQLEMYMKAMLQIENEK